MTRVGPEDEATGRPARRTGLFVKAVDLKKANKPLMEKRRRARINKSLDELKAMLMGSMKRSIPAHSKWEKADILEMSVQYVRTLRCQVNSRDEVAIGYAQFIAGFMNCIHQIQKLAVLDADPETKERYQPLVDQLMAHLKRFTDDASSNVSINFPNSPNCSNSPVGHVSDDTPTAPIPLSTSFHLHTGRLPHDVSPVIALEGCAESREIARQTPGSLWRPW
uniref:BHLH domain-containing protein n=1 Tax=Trichuris muris TaxID=70415 RepID=A0A5S6QXG7_TRIMR